MQIELKCNVCGNYLDYSVSKTYSDVILEVEPCSICLESERKAASDDGYDEGFNDGEQQGIKDGFDDGEHQGFNAGFECGLKEGR